ncbi:hypothetical protein DEJ04_00600 [Curtobacterium sp. MCLR17_044]|nr:hypothetical protein DEJ04_00600 [Curtobacterium sp. MCLR17_044]
MLRDARVRGGAARRAAERGAEPAVGSDAGVGAGARGAGCAGWCGVARVVRACGGARCVEPRTG